MKEQLTKLTQQATRSGFASAVHAHPTARETRLRVCLVLKPPAPPAEGETPPDPIDQARALVQDCGLTPVDLQYFPAARNPAVNVIVELAPKPKNPPTQK